MSTFAIAVSDSEYLVNIFIADLLTLQYSTWLSTHFQVSVRQFPESHCSVQLWYIGNQTRILKRSIAVKILMNSRQSSHRRNLTVDCNIAFTGTHEVARTELFPF